MDKVFIVSTEQIGRLCAFLEESGNQVWFAERRNLPNSQLHSAIRRGHEGILTFVQVETEGYIMLREILPRMFPTTWLYEQAISRELDKCLYGHHHMDDELALVKKLEEFNAVTVG